jgi:hypothetical protein
MSSRSGVQTRPRSHLATAGLRMTRANGSRIPQQYASGALTLSRNCEMCIAVQVLCSSVETEGRGAGSGRILGSYVCQAAFTARLRAMRQGRPRWLHEKNIFYYPRTTHLSSCSFGLACCIVRKHPGFSSLWRCPLRSYASGD